MTVRNLSEELMTSIPIITTNDPDDPRDDPNTITPRTRFTWRHQYETGADISIGYGTATHREERLEELRLNGVTDAVQTEQHHKEDADINVLMERMGVTNRDPLPNVPLSLTAEEFPEGLDLRTVLDLERQATDYFRQLPADLRKRFDNDKAKLWAFLQDEANDEEAIRLGLLHKKEADPVSPPPSTT